MSRYCNIFKFTISLFILLYSFSTFAQKYDDGDVKILKTFMEKRDKGEVSNAKKIEVKDLNDPGNYPWVTWTDTEPKRVNSIIWCYFKLGGELNLDGLDSLTYLNCSNNHLTSISIRGDHAITNLYIQSNKLSELLLDGFVDLEEVDYSNNDVSEEIIPRKHTQTQPQTQQDMPSSHALCNAEIKHPITEQNRSIPKFNTDDVAKLNRFFNEKDENGISNAEKLSITQLDDPYGYRGVFWTKAFPKKIKGIRWVNLNLEGNLDLSQSDSLRYLDCRSNKITSISLSNCNNIMVLSCFSNKLTSLNIKDCLHLKILFCFGNQLDNIDISNNEELSQIWCNKVLAKKLNTTASENLKKINGVAR